jgi:hypothetical protein
VGLIERCSKSSFSQITDRVFQLASKGLANLASKPFVGLEVRTLASNHEIIWRTGSFAMTSSDELSDALETFLHIGEPKVWRSIGAVYEQVI